MKRLLALVAVASVAAGCLLLVAPPAGAAVRSAADLAADCNDDGIVSLTSDTTYVGGVGEITGRVFFPGTAAVCLIDVDVPGITLKMKNVTLHGVGGTRINIGQSSAADTTISIANSDIETTGFGALAGELSIKSDCCGGISGGSGATVTITNSTLRGSSVELGASLGNADHGRFTLKGSTVIADGDEFTSLEDIFVRVSDVGEGADATLQHNTFTAANGFSVKVGTDGSLSVTNNDFTGVGGTTVVHAGAGSSCAASGNTPAVVCS
jgi:hypothetical protein